MRACLSGRKCAFLEFNAPTLCGTHEKQTSRTTAPHCRVHNRGNPPAPTQRGKRSVMREVRKVVATWLARLSRAHLVVASKSQFDRVRKMTGQRKIGSATSGRTRRGSFQLRAVDTGFCMLFAWYGMLCFAGAREAWEQERHGSKSKAAPVGVTRRYPTCKRSASMSWVLRGSESMAAASPVRHTQLSASMQDRYLLHSVSNTGDVIGSAFGLQ